MTRRSLLALAASAALACGGGSGSTPTAPLSDSALYAQAVQDYNAKAYATAKVEFQQLLARASATAYHDKATIYIAAIDYHQGFAATCLAVLGSPTAPLSGFFQAYPTSAEMDRARYWHGRCEMGIAPPDYLAARADFTAVIAMPAGAYTDNAWFWRGRTWYATALASPDLDASPDWASALADFSTVVGSFGTGTVAPEAKYWMGRTHFARGDLAKGRGTQAGDAVAQPEFSAALADLTPQPSTYPANTWIPDVNLYIGRTHLEQASYLATPAEQVTAYGAVMSELSPWLGGVNPTRDEANYWYGRATYERGAAGEAVPDHAGARADYQAAQTQFQKFQTDATLATSKLADNASYWVGRCLYALADLVKIEADAMVAGATYADAQTGFAAAQAQFAATKSGAQFATSNILDWVQIYLGRSQFQQGYCADRQMMGSGAAMYAAAQTSLAAYFTQFGTPVLPSAAAAHFWLGRTTYAQASLTSAIAEFNAVVTGWDWVGISTSTKPTTVWWDNAYYYLVRAYSDQATTASCSSALSAYTSLKTAIPADPFLAPACSYMYPARCPANTCP